MRPLVSILCATYNQKDYIAQTIEGFLLQKVNFPIEIIIHDDDAEERGQGVAIAESIETCLGIEVPLVSAIIGEGGSGGAIALSAADRVLMLEHSIYSVISPEGCASILWRDKAMAKTAAEALHLTAQDLLSFGIIDEIVAEPVGGAHRSPEEMVQRLGSALDKNLGEVKKYSGTRLKALRREKFLKLK